MAGEVTSGLTMGLRVKMRIPLLGCIVTVTYAAHVLLRSTFCFIQPISAYGSSALSFQRKWHHVCKDLGAQIVRGSRKVATVLTAEGRPLPGLISLVSCWLQAISHQLSFNLSQYEVYCED